MKDKTELMFLQAVMEKNQNTKRDKIPFLETSTLMASF